ncbi:hypothetical protein Trydic_g4147 [Trypoxylus dichotomus]
MGGVKVNGDSVKKSTTNVEKNVDEEGSEWPQIFAVFSAALTSLSNSILYNWTSPTIPILVSSDEYPDIDIEQASYLTVIPPIVSILAAPIQGYLLDRFGRKITLLVAGTLQISAWLCVIFTKSLYIFYLSRVLFGFGNAAMFTVLPVYISEVTTPKVRGRWGNLMAFFMYFGQFLANAIGYLFDIKTTACIFISVPIIFIVLFSLCPETPYFYLLKDKSESAENSLKKLRRLENVSREFAQLNTDLKRQLSEKGTYRDCIRIPSNRKAILIVGMGRALQQFTGISAFAAYNQYIFQEAGTSLDKGYSSMIYALSLSVCSFVGLMYIDKLGRKIPMVISCICCFVVLGAETIYFYLKDYQDIPAMATLSWFPLFGMVSYVTTFSLGLNLIPILLLSELFSTSIRSKAGTIITMLSAVYMTSINKLFQVLLSTYGLMAPFALFTVCAFTGVFLSYFFIPETKGKTLEEIQQMLKKNEKHT